MLACLPACLPAGMPACLLESFKNSDTCAWTPIGLTNLLACQLERANKDLLAGISA